MFIVLEIIQAWLYLFYCSIEAVIRWFVPVKKKSLAGKLVLVTGGGHGIGRELALQFSAVGARLAVLDINKSNAEKVVAEIQENGGTATPYVCDVTKIDQIKAVADNVRRDIGNVDVLVNNAGILNGGSLLTMSESDIRRTFEVNTLACFWTCREFLPSMINRNEGHIVNVASMSGKRGVAYLTDYSSSKHAVKGLSEALADELRREGHDGIQITTVYPMFVNTGLVKFIINRIGKLLEPEEVAAAIVDGTQRNERSVHIPARMAWISAIGGFLPVKFVDNPPDVLYAGITPQK